MPHAMTLPVVAGLAIVGAAAGIGLGHSTLAEINPAYFEDHEGSRFFADLSPNQPSQRTDWAQVQAAEYQQQAIPPAAPPAAQGGCVGCATWPMDPRPKHDPAVDRALAQAWREARAPAPAPEVRYVRTVVYEEAPRDPARERIRRYSSYPITRDEAPPPPDPWDGADEGDAATQ